jgi:large subunit ribosomal protein L10
MPSQKNIQALADLKDKVAKSKTIVFTDYRGLTVKQFTELRQKVKEAGGDLKVIKNTLLNLGLKDLPPLTGPTATLFSFEDEVAPLKTLYEFAKKNEIPVIKLGFFGEKLLSKEEVIELAKLPGQDVLRAKLVNILNAPIAGFVYALKGNLTKLVVALDQIKLKLA